MDGRTLSSIGFVGSAAVVVTTLLGIYGFIALLDAPGELLAPAIGTLVVTILVVGALTALGSRSKRWRENPYW